MRLRGRRVEVFRCYGSAPAFSLTLVIVSSQPFLSPALSCARAFSMRSRASFTPAAVDLAFESVGFTSGDAARAFGELDEVGPPGSSLPVTFSAPVLSSRRSIVAICSAQDEARAGPLAASPAP